MPTPNSVSTQIVPPCASTMPLTETPSFARGFLGLAVTLEQVRQDRIGNAWPRIPNCNACHPIPAVCGNRKRASFRSELDCVSNQVRKNLKNAISITHHMQGSNRRLDFELEILLFRSWRERLKRATDQFVNVLLACFNCEVPRFDARCVQQIANHSIDSVSRAPDRLGMLVHLRKVSLRRNAQQGVRRQDDRPQGAPKVVGDDRKDLVAGENGSLRNLIEPGLSIAIATRNARSWARTSSVGE